MGFELSKTPDYREPISPRPFFYVPRRQTLTLINHADSDVNLPRMSPGSIFTAVVTCS